MRYTGPEDDWVVPEFLGSVGYSAPGGGIAAVAGHHLHAGRWLRDTRYLDDHRFVHIGLKFSGSVS